MKNFRNKSLFLAVLSAFVLTGCQGQTHVEPETKPTGSVETPTPNAVDPNKSAAEARVREIDNGVIVIKQTDERVPHEGLTFRVDSLNEEFTLELSELSSKDTGKRLLNLVYSLFLCDVNRDGYLDFIYTTSGGRSLSEAGTWIGVYDYHNHKELYRLDDPLEWDYDLCFEDRRMTVNKYNTDYYITDNVLELNRLVGKGILDYSGETITTRWQNFLGADSINFGVTTADRARTPMTMEPGQRENAFVIKHADPDKAYCITTNLVRNNGNYDDLSTDLPVGYYGDCLFKQAVANSHQDNVIVSFEGVLQGMEEGSYFVEACVSGYEFEIIFEFDSLDHISTAPTLMQTAGWSFTKQELIEYSHEYIPGNTFNPNSEEDYPFMYVAVAREGEATSYSYNLLEGRVAEIDAALVNTGFPISHYNFKTSGQTYTLDQIGPFFKCGDSFYSVISWRDYRYANSNSEGYDRFRDERTEIAVEPMVSSREAKVLRNANKIVFDRKSLKDNEKTGLLNRAQYSFTIANNKFYVIDSKTMVWTSNLFTVAHKCTAVSDYDFSSLF